MKIKNKYTTDKYIKFNQRVSYKIFKVTCLISVEEKFQKDSCIRCKGQEEKKF